MDFTVNQISVDNLFRYGFNALEFSIMGMLIVFGGLAIISLYIALLPKVLALPASLGFGVVLRGKVAAEKAAATADKELLLAIAVALHLDQTRNGTDQKITWQRYEEEASAWQVAGRIRGLATRSHLPGRGPVE